MRGGRAKVKPGLSAASEAHPNPLSQFDLSSRQEAWGPGAGADGGWRGPGERWRAMAVLGSGTAIPCHLPWRSSHLLFMGEQGCILKVKFKGYVLCAQMFPGGA